MLEQQSTTACTRSGMMIGIIGQQPKSYRNSAQAIVSCERGKDKIRAKFIAL